MGETVSLTLRFIGVTLDSLGGNATFLKTVFVKDGRHNRVAEEAASGPWDFVVICSKCFSRSSPSLSNTIKSVVGPSTVIVLVQN
jgi:hypothetical protein